MGQLTTHVLDTANGCTGSGITVELFRVENPAEPISSCVTNSDGRCDAALLSGAEFTNGEYQLVFHVGDYFSGKGMGNSEPRFLDRVCIRFGVANAAEHYHVPLLVSPWAYSTYRGS